MNVQGEPPAVITPEHKAMGKGVYNTSVSSQRAEFTKDLAELLVYGNSLPGWSVGLDEVYRPPWLARFYALAGKGIKNSLHTIGLAADLDLWIEGRYQTSALLYVQLGAAWKAKNPLNRWGGDWASRDYRHFERRPA